MSNIVLETKAINKDFKDPILVRVLTDINMQINKAEFVALTGKSGCGKSTLLYILSTMDTEYDGELWIDNSSMHNKKEAELAQVRNEKIGFVFQFHYLLNEFSVLKNVMLPALKLGKLSIKEIEDKAMQKLKMLNIENLATKNANQVSGGEKQRVAIARAMINDPLVIMGDEPTGNLDKKNSEIVFEIFKKLAEEYQQTLLIVTHDQSIADRSHRIIEMEDGKIISKQK